MAKGWHKPTAWVNSPQADEVAEYYAQGHTMADTAIKFGVSKYQVGNLAKLRGLSNGRDFKSSANEKRKQEAETRITEKLDSLGFDYAGGYVNGHGKIMVKCRACGDVFERTAKFIKTGNLICKKCEHEKALARQAKQRIVRKAETEKRQAEHERYKATHPPKDAYVKLHEAFLNREGTCEICGKHYTVKEYVESCGIKCARDNGVCSDKCRRIKANRQIRDSRKRRGVQDTHRHRAVKYGCAYDSSVTLKKLIKRDGLRCAICGEMCDANDHSWTEFCGPKYPSIDHIIPMSRGGGHVWDNVQVAHIICNSEKGDSNESIERKTTSYIGERHSSDAG
jgi:5-methylcytosine-specific restriction endonuclease McrA